MKALGIVRRKSKSVGIQATSVLWYHPTLGPALAAVAGHLASGPRLHISPGLDLQRTLTLLFQPDDPQDRDGGSVFWGGAPPSTGACTSGFAIPENYTISFPSKQPSLMEVTFLAIGIQIPPHGTEV